MRMPVSFHRNQKLNFWMQVYNLGIDDKSKQNAATIQYQIMDMDSNKTVMDTSEDSKSISQIRPGDGRAFRAPGQSEPGQIQGNH